MADGGAAPGSGFVENTSEALAKPYELSHPLSAGQIDNINEMLEILFNALKENEIVVEAVVEDVEVLQEAAESGGLLIQHKSLTVAQLQSLNTTPVEAIASVSGKVIVPFRWTMQQQMGTDTWSVAPIVTPVYAGGTVTALASITITNTASVKKTVTEISAVSTGTNNLSYSGVGINLRGSADRTGGSGSYDYYLAYYLIDGKY